jgi:hypothetical protein
MSCPDVPACGHRCCGLTDPLTIDSAITGMIAFASQAAPLLIYTTLSRKSSKSLLKLRDSVIANSSFLQLLQPYLTNRSKKPLELGILITCLSGAVLAFSDLERYLSGASISRKHGVLKLGALRRWMLRSIGVRLRNLGVALGLVVEIMHW